MDDEIGMLLTNIETFVDAKVARGVAQLQSQVMSVHPDTMRALDGGVNIAREALTESLRAIIEN